MREDKLYKFRNRTKVCARQNRIISNNNNGEQRVSPRSYARFILIFADSNLNGIVLFYSRSI